MRGLHSDAYCISNNGASVTKKWGESRDSYLGQRILKGGETSPEKKITQQSRDEKKIVRPADVKLCALVFPPQVLDVF
jgi:hypothetical protein